MVKGVNKTVIVVNNTGSKYFERIVFYVSPEYGTVNIKELNEAAEKFSFGHADNNREYSPGSLRKRYRKKKRILTFAVLGVAVAVLGITAAIIL